MMAVAFVRAPQYALLESTWEPSAAFEPIRRTRIAQAEVEMALATTYEIRIPEDSIAETNTAGLLGEVYVNIDTAQASGAPIENYGYLKSKPSKTTLSLADQLKAADVLLQLVRTIKEAEKEVPKDTGAPTHP